METKLYYFSGTGNCLSVAKALADDINGKIVAIPAMMNHTVIKLDESKIIFVFPSYLAPLCGVPLIVERFIRKIEQIESKYLIAICTCGGYEIVNAIPPLKKLKKMIQSIGGTLSEEYSVRFPMNNLDYGHIPVPIEKDTGIILNNSRKKIKAISKRILNGKGTKNDGLKTLFNYLMTPMYNLMKAPCLISLRGYAKEQNQSLSYQEIIPLTDRSIVVDENCNGCGTCVKICPVGNIELVNKKPVWKNHCEICFACDEWCPRNAIQHWSRGKGVKYHHPEITINDMIVKRELIE